MPCIPQLKAGRCENTLKSKQSHPQPRFAHAMAENIPPTTAIGTDDDPTRGMPYHDKVTADLKVLIYKKRVADKTVVRSLLLLCSHHHKLIQTRIQLRKHSTTTKAPISKTTPMGISSSASKTTSKAPRVPPLSAAAAKQASRKVSVYSRAPLCVTMMSYVSGFLSPSLRASPGHCQCH